MSASCLAEIGSQTVCNQSASGEEDSLFPVVAAQINKEQESIYILKGNGIGTHSLFWSNLGVLDKHWEGGHLFRVPKLDQNRDLSQSSGL
jgi:hypothetical protein